MKNLFELAEVHIPEVVVDHAHRNRRVYKDCTSDKTLKE